MLVLPTGAGFLRLGAGYYRSELDAYDCGVELSLEAPTRAECHVRKRRLVPVGLWIVPLGAEFLHL